MKISYLIATLALLCGGATIATAQDAPRQQRGNRNAARAAGRFMTPEMIKKYDKDGDGKLSDEERQEAMKAMREEAQERQKAMIAKYDKDGDGKLNEEERKAMQEDLKAEEEEFMKKYDKDGDGKLSDEERKAAQEDGAEIPRRLMFQRGNRGPGFQRGNRGEGNERGNWRNRGNRGNNGGGNGAAAEPEAPAKAAE